MTSHASQSGRPRHVRDWFRKLITFWTLIAVVSAGALAVFADVGEDVAEHSTTQFDNAVRGWFVAHQNALLLVGLTRLYLDVHWTTDVIGGWAVGLFVAAVTAALYERLRKSIPPTTVRA